MSLLRETQDSRHWQKLREKEAARGGGRTTRGRPPTPSRPAPVVMTASRPIDIPPPEGRGGCAGPRSVVAPLAVDAAAQRAVADAMWRTSCERLLPSQDAVDAACAAEPAAAWGFYLPLPAAYGYGPPAGGWSPPAYDAYGPGVAVRRTSWPNSSSASSSSASSASSASSSPSQSRSPPPHGRKPTRRSKRGGRRGGAAVRARR